MFLFGLFQESERNPYRCSYLEAVQIRNSKLQETEDALMRSSEWVPFPDPKDVFFKLQDLSQYFFSSLLLTDTSFSLAIGSENIPT